MAFSRVTVLLLFVGIFISTASLAKTKKVNIDSVPKVDVFWDNFVGPDIKVLSTRWVWMRSFAGTKNGTPAIRVTINVNLPDTWLWHGKAKNARLFKSEGKKLVIDLVSSTGFIEISFIQNGISIYQKLLLVSDVKRTSYIPLKKCSNHHVELMPESKPSKALFLGYSCLETDSKVMVEVVKSADSDWTYPDDLKDSQKTSVYFEYKKETKDSMGASKNFIVETSDQNGMKNRFEFVVLKGRDVYKEKPIKFGGELGMRYFSGSRRYDKRHDFLGVKGVLTQESRFKSLHSYAEGRVYLEQFSRLGETIDYDLREIYADWYTFSFLKFRFGKQITLWGRADEINPINVWVPVRHGLLVTQVPNEQRTGAWIAQLQLTNDLIGDLEFDFSPLFTQSDIYINDSLLDRNLKPRAQKGYSGGLRWDRQWGLLETGLSFFNGIKPEGNITLRNGNAIVQDFDRTYMLGLDGVIGFESWAFRWEIAKTWVNGSNFSVGEKRDEVFAVLGAERTFNDGNGRVIIQTVLKKVSDFNEGKYDSTTLQKTFIQPVENLSRLYHGQNVENPLAISAKVSRKFFDQKLELELLVMQDVNSSSHLVRPKAKYLLDKNWNLDLGWEYYGGSEDGIFWLLRKNKLAFLELNYTF